MKVSVVLLNWQRPRWLRWLILPHLVRHPQVDEIVVSHGRKDTAFNFTSRHARVVHREDWKLNPTYGLSLRFLAASEATNESVLVADDDLVVEHRAITLLAQALEGQRGLLHGILGRTLSADYEYQYGHHPIGPVPIMLTRAVMMDRSYADLFLREAPKAEHLVVRGVPKWNGEDIYLSLLSILRSGDFPKAYDLKYWDVLMSSRGSILKTKVSDPSGLVLPHREYRRWFSRQVVDLLDLGPTIDALAERYAEQP